MKSPVELNRLLLKFVLLCQVDIQESSSKKNTKFRFLGRAKGPRKCIFQAFKEPKFQNFGNHGATSSIYQIYYKPPVLSYSEVGTYALESLFVLVSLMPDKNQRKQNKFVSRKQQWYLRNKSCSDFGVLEWTA